MKRNISFLKPLFLVLLLISVISFFISQAVSDPLANVAVSSLVAVAFIAFQFNKKKKKFDGLDIMRNDFTEGLCEAIQTSMIEIYKANTMSSRRTHVGFLQAIKSPVNTSGIKIMPLDDGSGKIREVRIKGIVRGCEDDIEEELPVDCTPEKFAEPWEDIISNFNPLASPAFGFSEDDMRRLCEGDDAYRASIINAHLDPFMRKLNKLLITNQNANFGNFYDGTNAVHPVDLLKVNGDPIYLGEAQILEEIENLEFSGKPLVIGSGNLGRYIRQVGIGCCNDGGLDLSQAGNMLFYRDKYVEDIIGSNEFIALIPGFLQLVTLNKYKGAYRKENDVFSHTTFVDPWTGLEIDMKVHYDDCTEEFYMQFFTQWKLVRIPTKAIAYCDELYGFNGSLNFRADQQTP